MAIRGCRTRGGCLLTIIVLIIVIIGGGITFKFVLDDAYLQMLKNLGFSSEAEFEEFSDKMNEPFDDTLILVNEPIASDGENAKNKLLASISLNNGQDLFLENGKFNIESMQNSGDVVVNSDFELNEREYCYILNLLIASLDEADNENDAVLKQINYQFISSTTAKFNFYVDIDASKIKKEIGKLGSFVPDRLLLNIGATLDATQDVISAGECSIHINALDAETNAKFLNVLGIILDKSESELEQFVGDLIAEICTEVFSSIDCKMIFNNDIISIQKKSQGV